MPRPTSRLIVRRFAALFAAAALLVLGGNARAASTHVVLLTDAGESEADAPLSSAANGQLAELGVELDVSREAQPSLTSNARRAREISASSATLAVVWVERGSRALTVYFYDPRGPRLYSRRVARSDSAGADAEEIAIVIRSAVNAVSEGDAVAMAELQLPDLAVPRAEPLPQPVAQRTPPTQTESVLRLGASYVGTLYSADAPWQNGAALSVSFRPRSGPWFAGVAYTYFGALSLTEQEIHTEIRRHPGEVFAGAELHLAPFLFVAEGALVADRVGRSTEQVPDDLAAAPDSERWLWAISTRLGVAVPLGDRVRLAFNLGAEFLVNRFDYVVSSGQTGADLVASPMLARPRVELGLNVGLW